jgi:hypothetical protein
MKTKTRRYKLKNRKTRRGGMNFLFGFPNKYKEFFDNAEKFQQSCKSIFNNEDTSNMTINSIIAKAKLLQDKENPVQAQVTQTPVSHV